jgi:hypothetical protein
MDLWKGGSFLFFQENAKILCFFTDMPPKGQITSAAKVI